MNFESLNRARNATLAVILATGLMMPTAGMAYAADNDSDDTSTKVKDKLNNLFKDEVDDNTPSKSESVYVFANADGSVKNTVVTNWLKNTTEAKNIADITSLSDIQNTEGDETYDANGQSLTWHAQGKDIYYQGNTDKKAPVELKVTYWLDGIETAAEDMAGKSGHVRIRFDYKNNEYSTRYVDGAARTVYTPFMCLTGMILDNGVFKNVKTKHAKSVNDGDRTLVGGYALPGLQEDLDIDGDGLDIPNYFEIEADVTDFEMGTTATIVTTSLFDNVNTEELNDDEIGDSLNELSDAMGKLIDGTDALYKGMKKLDAGGKQLADGTAKLEKNTPALAEGVQQLADGSEQLANGTSELKDGSSQLAGGAAQANEGVDQLIDGNKQVTSGAGNLNAGLKQLKDGTKTSTGLKDALDSLGDEETEGTLIGGANSLEGGASALKDGADSLTEGIGNLSAGAGDLAEGAGSLSEGAGDLATGADSLAQNLPQLKAGVESIGAGANEAVTALGQLQQATSGEKQYLDGASSGLEGVSSALTGASSKLGNASNAKEALGAVNTEGMTDKDIAAINAAITALGDAADAQEALATASGTISGIKENAVDEANKLNTTVSGGLETLSEKLGEAKDGAKTIAQGLGQAATGADKLATGANGLKDGADKVAGGANSLKDGADQAATGAGSLAEGADTLTTGAGTLKNGLDTLKNGTDGEKLPNGKTSEGLAAAVDALSDQIIPGSSQLKSGSGQVGDGLKTLKNDGLTPLSEGANSLAAGAKQVDDGAGKLANGLSDLNNSVPELAAGITALKDGSVALSDGIDAATKGTKKLKEGLTTFDEEGIQKIIDAYNDNIAGLADRLKATAEAGQAYDTFTGKSDSMKGSVKFIYETDPIEVAKD